MSSQEHLEMAMRHVKAAVEGRIPELDPFARAALRAWLALRDARRELTPKPAPSEVSQ